MNHTSVQSESGDNRCECKTQDSIPFLDTLCTIVDGEIKILGDVLIRAKVHKIPRRHQEKQLKGLKKCGKMCTGCPYVKEGK